MQAKKNIINWDEIDTILLDMDGTLLDRHYEDFFWEIEVPKHYAAKNGLTVKEAKKQLMDLYFKEEKSMKWSDIDFWEKELNMKLWDMRLQIKHLAKLHPHTIRFLRFLKKHRKKIYLVTASDHRDVKLKIKHSKIGKYFDGIYNQFDLGKPKYEKIFWKKLQERIRYINQRTLFIDDNEEIIMVAKSTGIKWLVMKSKFSSRRAAKIPKNLLYVHHLDDIIPESKAK